MELSGTTLVVRKRIINGGVPAVVRGGLRKHNFVAHLQLWVAGHAEVHELPRAKKELEASKKENEDLRKNAGSAKTAAVSGIAGAGAGAAATKPACGYPG